MPGFYDPVSATFVQSVLADYLGYSLFENINNRAIWSDTSKNTIGIWTVNNINAMLGLGAVVPRIVLLEARIAFPAGPSADVGAYMQVNEGGGGIRIVHRAAAPGGLSQILEVPKDGVCRVSSGSGLVDVTYQILGSNNPVEFHLSRLAAVY